MEASLCGTWRERADQSQTCPENPKLRTLAPIEEKILYTYTPQPESPTRPSAQKIDPTIRYEKQGQAIMCRLM